MRWMKFDLVSFGRVFVLKQTMQFHIYVGRLVTCFIWVKIRNLFPWEITPCVILRFTLLNPAFPWEDRGEIKLRKNIVNDAKRTMLKWGSKERLSISLEGWRLRKDIKNEKYFKTFFSATLKHL